MDWHNVVEFLKTIYAATPSVIWAAVGGVTGYFAKSFFDRRREKNKQHNKKNAEEFEKLYNLAAGVLSAFGAKDDSKIHKSSPIYLEGFNKSIIDKSKLIEIKEQNDVLKEIFPQLKPEYSRAGGDLMGQEERKKWEQQRIVEANKRKVLREKGEAASNKIVELLNAEYKCESGVEN